MNAAKQSRSATSARMRADADRLALQCSRCHSVVEYISRSRPDDHAALICPICLMQVQRKDGIWNTLPDERAAHYAAFIENYEAVRTSEGRGSRNAEFYLSLPERDISRRNQGQWEIRRRTYECMERVVLRAIEQAQEAPLDILDLGAGNCWLSYRLALRGHRPVAVDLLENPFDGLGAAKHYQSRLPYIFPRFRAELDRLPFGDEQFDVAIFNASLHYSEDYARTLGEALRCLRRPGCLIIADTAWYGSEESGRAMVEERQAAFHAKYGFASDALASQEFLTDERLRALGKVFGLRWNAITPRYGLKWRLRPLMAKLRGRREPSRFRIFTAEVTQ